MKKTIGLIAANYINENLAGPSEERSLAAIPFGGRYRLIDFPLSNMMNSGIHSVGIVLPFNSRSLIDHVGTGKSWGFGRKTNALFMLQGSLYGQHHNDTKFLLKDIIGNIRFFTYDDADYVLMCGCDKVYSMDFKPMIKQHEEAGCKITKLCKGKNFLDCFIINRDFLLNIIKWFENLEFMSVIDIIDKYLPETEMGVYQFIGYSHNIDSLQDYYEASKDLLVLEVEQQLFHSAGLICTNIQDRCPTFYAPTAKVKNSLVAAGCTIDGTVENSIIFRSSHIEKNAIVKDSILMQHAHINEGAELSYVICDKRVTINKGSKVNGTKEKPCFIKKGQTL